MAETTEPKDSPFELGFTGTGPSLIKSAGLATTGVVAMAVLHEVGIYPDVVVIHGKQIALNGVNTVAVVTGALTWLINVARKFVMRYSE